MSVPDRMARMLGGLEAGPVGGRSPAAWCESARQVVGASGAGVMLMFGDHPAGSLCTTDHVSARIEELQFTLGEGPCVDAYREGRAVLESDLARPHVLRWPAFTSAALDAGVRAIFSFPVQLSGARLGALDFYSDTAGPMRHEQHEAGILLAEAIARWVLDAQAGAAPGILGRALSGADQHAVVHNAAGAVSVQAGVGIPEALILLRAYAFRTGRPLGEVAADVAARRLRFSPDGAVRENGQG